MRKRSIVWMSAAGLAALVAGTGMAASAAPSCDAAAILRDAERRYGTADLRSIAIEAHGSDNVIGQSFQPGGRWPRFTVESYRRWVDLDAPASDLVQVRVQGERPPRGGARQPLEREEQRIAVAPGSAKRAALVRELATLLPAAAVRLIAGAGVPVAARGSDGLCTITAPLAGGSPLEIGFAPDGELRTIRTVTAHDVLGDLPQVTRFEGSLAGEGARFPARIRQDVGGFPVLDLVIDRVTRNVAGGVAADVTPPKLDWMAAESMPSRKLGEGIFLLPARYSSIAIDTGADITLIEAPQSERRTREILAEVERLIPGKPIARVVYTHAHLDHLGGLRTVAERVGEVIVHRDNVAYVQELLRRPRTLAPDALSRAPRSPVVRGVGDYTVLGQGDRAVRLYHLPKMDHVRGMLIAYIPATRTLIEADAFTPTATPRSPLPSTPSPYTVQLLAAVERLKLEIDEIVPIHFAADSRRVGMADLRRQAGRPD